MNPNLKNIIVTGASRGIGKATVLELIHRTKYFITGTSTTGTAPYTHEHFNCIPLRLDHHESIVAAVEKIKKANIKIHGIINNAAILLEEWDNPSINMQQLKQTFNTNVFGTIEFTESLLSLVENNSHIINLSSGWGAFNDPWFDDTAPHYKMSKASVNMYTMLLAKRLESRKIIVSAIDPGWVKTDMGTKNASRKPEEVAVEIVDLLESKVESGKFWHKGKIRSW